MPSWRPGALIDRAGIALEAWTTPHDAAARTVILAVLDAL
jgi:hypothetical protein